MSDDETNEGNDKGKETDNSIKTAKETVFDLRKENDRAEAINKERKELIEREEELQAKKELGGHADAGQERVKTPEELEKEKANDRIMKIGKAVGAEWAKPKD